MVSLNTVLKKRLCEMMISFHRDSFHFGLQRNYTPMFRFDIWGSENPALTLTIWQSLGWLSHFQRRCSSPWWAESVAHKFAETERMLVGCCVGFCCLFFFFLGMNHLLSPGFELAPWESTFGRFFNPNLWVLLAPIHCGNSFRNSSRLEREKEKRSERGKEREKFLRGLANLSKLLANVVWIPSLRWNLKPGKFLVIWGSAMNVLHSSS